VHDDKQVNPPHGESPVIEVQSPIDVGTENKMRLSGVSKDYGTGASKFTALADVSLEIGSGEFVSIVGPSGCGKTTLLRIMAGLETLSAGSVSIRRGAGNGPASSVVFQEASIFPWMTTRQNAEYGLALRGIGKKERRATVGSMLETVGLAQFADRYPHELSGGMKQRTSLVRAFANDPEILLMDEPFAAVDEQTRIVLQEELLRIWETTSKTVVFITHSIQEALTLSDRVVVMGTSPGQIQTTITVPFDRPRDVYKLKADPRFGELEYAIWERLRAKGSARTPAMETG
jgi:NitT/TauT family transport system ATP-binding protein